jgi:RNA polymerase sigma-70 factor (ECF subfamily)
VKGFHIRHERTKSMMNSACKKQFEAIMPPHLGAVYNLPRWLSRNEHDASDVVQESYLRAFRFFNSYKDGDPRAWLMSIVRNTHRTWLRAEAAAHRGVVAFDEEAVVLGRLQPRDHSGFPIQHTQPETS